VNENIKLSRAILSRFDLVFILLDEPNEERDRRLSEHVMAMHSRRQQDSLGCASRGFQPRATSTSLIDGLHLQQRLQQRGPEIEPVPVPLLRKYISYVRKYCHPVVSPEAQQILKNYYLSLRSRSQSRDSTPITTRQLESMIRLAEARAKIDLREVVTEDDAQVLVSCAQPNTQRSRMSWI